MPKIIIPQSAIREVVSELFQFMNPEIKREYLMEAIRSSVKAAALHIIEANKPPRYYIIEDDHKTIPIKLMDSKSTSTRVNYFKTRARAEAKIKELEIKNDTSTK